MMLAGSVPFVAGAALSLLTVLALMLTRLLGRRRAIP
jgi:hypothetical protein